ncbi:spore coat protein YsxE [Bacillus fengqiuensis]|nr:spore coat protein YsxE [Bacillus fengqiuensis]
MRHETIVDYQELLHPYRLKVDFVEDYGKMKKVYTDKGTFALKKLASSSRQGTNFIQTMSALSQKGFMKMVRPYHTHDGQYIVYEGTNAYYMMPWLPNEPKEERDIRYHKLFQELAQLHSITSHEIKLKQEDVKGHYDLLNKQWENRKEDLKKYVAECEQKVYMAPFELYFCMFYHECSQALGFARSKLDEWYEIMKEKENARLVTIHGKLSSKHFVYDENGNGYFINFEQAKEASPIYDIMSFYFRAFKTYPIQSYENYEWFTTYQQRFPLKEEELLLFYSYLAFPESIVRAVDRYRNERKSQTEMKHVQTLVAAYWHMKNIEQLLTRIMQAEQQKKAAAEQAAQAQANT